LKVLSLSYCFPNAKNPTWGVFVLQRLAALARRTELDVVAPVPAFPLYSRFNGSSLPKVESIDNLRVYHPRFFYVPAFFKHRDGYFYGHGLRRWLGRYCRDHGRPDVLDAHFVWPDGVGPAYLSRKLGIPFTITLRGKLYPCLEAASMRRQCAEALQAAAAVISVSSPMAAEARKLGVADEKLHVIPNGVDRGRFFPRDRAEARRELGLSADVRLVVLVAHLKPTKGAGDLVEAMAVLPEDVHAVVVGGEVERIAFRNELAARIEQLGLAGRVRLVGPQPYEKVPLYLAAANVCLLASHREGCPNVVLEVLASGRPVVATRVGAAPDLVRDGVDGRIVPPADPPAMAAAIAEVLAKDFSPDALSRAPAVRTWDEVAAETLAVLAAAAGR